MNKIPPKNRLSQKLTIYLNIQSQSYQKFSTQKRAKSPLTHLITSGTTPTIPQLKPNMKNIRGRVKCSFHN